MRYHLFTFTLDAPNWNHELPIRHRAQRTCCCARCVYSASSKILWNLPCMSWINQSICEQRNLIHCILQNCKIFHLSFSLKTTRENFQYRNLPKKCIVDGKFANYKKVRCQNKSSSTYTLFFCQSTGWVAVLQHLVQPAMQHAQALHAKKTKQL